MGLYVCVCLCFSLLCYTLSQPSLGPWLLTAFGTATSNRFVFSSFYVLTVSNANTITALVKCLWVSFSLQLMAFDESSKSTEEESKSSEGEVNKSHAE